MLRAPRRGGRATERQMSTSAEKPKISDRVDSNAPTQPRMRAAVASSEAETRRIRPVPREVKPREESEEPGRYSQVFGRTNKAD
jgi:hypothetical protein